MHVELRDRQLVACRAAVTNQRPYLLELFGVYLDGARPAPGTKTTRVMSMPAIGWRILADTLSQELYLPGGRTRGKVAASTRSALKQVSRAVIMREAHPALRGCGVAGHVGDIIPAWKHDRGWSPYPQRDETGWLLKPRYFDPQGVKATLWWAQPWTEVADNPWWLQEHAHLAFTSSNDEAIRPRIDGLFGEA